MGCGLQASTAENAQISKGNKNDNSEHIMPENLPDEFAIKVHKTTLAEYKHRLEYIKNDYRFGERVKNMNDRKFVHQWAEKEMHNLIRMHQNGIPCPEVVLVKKHVILMSFIGNNSVPAPQLRQAKLSTKNQQVAYQQTIDLMKDLFQKCNLVHGDLNIRDRCEPVGGADPPIGHAHAVERLPERAQVLQQVERARRDGTHASVQLRLWVRNTHRRRNGVQAEVGGNKKRQRRARQQAEKLFFQAAAGKRRQLPRQPLLRSSAVLFVTRIYLVSSLRSVFNKRRFMYFF